jgi:hypothetical protein
MVTTADASRRAEALTWGVIASIHVAAGPVATSAARKQQDND